MNIYFNAALSIFILQSIISCSVDPIEDPIDPMDDPSSKCEIYQNSIIEIEGDGYIPVLSDTSIIYTYYYNDDLLDEIRSEGDNIIFKFTYKNGEVETKTKSIASQGVIYRDSFEFDNQNRLIQIGRYNNSNTKEIDLVISYSFDLATRVDIINISNGKNSAFTFSYKDGDIIKLTSNEGMRTLSHDSIINTLNLLNFIFSERDMTQLGLDFVLVFSKHSVINTYHKTPSRPSSSRGYIYNYKEVCGENKLQEYIVFDTLNEYNFREYHSKFEYQ